MPRFLDVREIYKSARILSRLKILPSLKEDNQNFGSYIFQFPDTQEVREELRRYLQDAELKSFIEAYKYLRSLIYQKRRESDD